MAKKPNEPFRQFIPVVNNSEMFNVSRALVDKDIFQLLPQETSAIANISDSKKNIMIEITEYDILNNPSIVMQVTKKEEIVKKVKERLEHLDQEVRDIYVILFAHAMNNKVVDGSENEGKTHIALDEIHFGYRGLTGKNKESSLTDEQYKIYVQAIDILANTKVKIDITKETNIVYEKLKKLNMGAFEGFLINNITWVWNTNNTKLQGIYYDLGLLGEAYTKHAPQINNRYPTALLQMHKKNYSTAKNIGNYLCFLHRCNENQNNKTTTLNLYSLMGESRYEIKPPYIQQGLDRFIKHLGKIIEVLKSNTIVSDIEIPEDIHSKNYKEKQIMIHWIYKTNHRV